MQTVMNLAYLLAAVLFILGLKGLSSPRTARRGNLLAMLGMLVAVVITLFNQNILTASVNDIAYMIAALVVGAALGGIGARRVAMTDMPQLVALFNGFGGAASTLVAISEYTRGTTGNPTADFLITIALSVIIGSLTFTGSVIAFAKLQGLMTSSPIAFPMQHLFNSALLVAAVVLGAFLVIQPSALWIVLAITTIAAVLGVMAVIPVGGADMPVIISFLNSCSGLAAAATGFVLYNNVLIISGALVGASGLILTQIMCKAMNRSLGNVLFAGVGTADGGGTGKREGRDVIEYDTEDAAMVLQSASTVIIIPGYGLAVAQAQHVLQELADLLSKNGTTVRYAIHPVAGRMPGHMNVLLAEASVSYDQLCEMDQINEEFQNTDVALVIGANDVINPAARYKKDSVLFGMPILNADRARSVMIVKRSLSPGFAGEDNELFYDKKTMMVFGDAKKVVTDLLNNLKI